MNGLKFPETLCLFVKPEGTGLNLNLVPVRFCQGILKRGKARCAERKTGLFLALSGFLCAPVTVPDGGVQRLWDDCEISQSQKDRISFFCVQRGRAGGPVVAPFFGHQMLKTVIVETMQHNSTLSGVDVAFNQIMNTFRIKVHQFRMFKTIPKFSICRNIRIRSTSGL